MKTKNIFDISDISDKNVEVLSTIFSQNNIKVTREVSFGNPSPDGYWYDQNETELVILLKGTATLLFEKIDKVHLKSGDYITIEPHLKHRVEKVSDDAMWLAIFIR